MTLWRLALRSFQYFARANSALLLGVAVGTAVLTGALIVGDSIRDSLAGLTIQRLGRIDEVLLGEQFFRQELAETLDIPSQSAYDRAIPAILLNHVTAESQVELQRQTARTHGVTLVGVDADFWEFDLRNLRPIALPGTGEIVVNQALADELHLHLGDRILVRFGRQQGAAADSALGRKEDIARVIPDLKVVAIVPTQGLGRFSLFPSQQLPATGFVSLQTLQRGVGEEGKINAIFVSGVDGKQPPSDASFQRLKEQLRPTIADLGLTLKRVELSYDQGDGKKRIVSQYDQLTTSRMLFSPAAQQVLDPIVKQLGNEGTDVQSAFTYMATRIERLNADGIAETSSLVPYSTITAIDPHPVLGPLIDDQQNSIHVADNKIVIHRWTANALNCRVGDRLRLTYFDPETSHGKTIERQHDFELQAIVELTTPADPFSRRRPAVFHDPPMLANDPDLTPEVVGVTDQDSMSDWDAPFPLDYSLLSPRDDEYWEDFRTTPKAYVSLTTGRKLWGSRFGETSSYRFPPSAALSLVEREDKIAAALRGQIEAFGLRWLRVKRDGLAASRGTTPFDVLFLGFSMFIIASALMLVVLLLRLALEQRARQLGLLAALGFESRRTGQLLIREYGMVCGCGTLLGVILGVGYAWLMLVGLRTWWLAAVVTPFMELSLRPRSLGLGGLLGMAASLVTIGVTLRRLRRLSVTQLMGGVTESVDQRFSTIEGRRRTWTRLALPGLIVIALGLMMVAPRFGMEAQAGAFFGAGSLVLTAMLMGLSGRLKYLAVRSGDATDLSVASLARRNLARNPGRSVLTVGLVAAACFLIIAISAFRLAPSEQGTGGFSLIAQSDLPIFDDLHNIEVRNGEWGTKSLDGISIFPLRFQGGDDASCRNLYRAARPQLLGITNTFLQHAHEIGQFEWAGAVNSENPWGGLDSPATADKSGQPIPVIIDKNTAMYSLQLFGGVGEEFEMDYGDDVGKLRFRVVGLLAGSIFQGKLIVNEANLVRHFPQLQGYRYFLVATPHAQRDHVAQLLESTWSDQGMDVVQADRLLTELLAVQNTYLSTFQSLGGLGLLLGTLGLVAVQLRNVFQRRGELALLRAVGYERIQLIELVLREHMELLWGGLTIGTLAAAFVVLPHWLSGGAAVPVVSVAGTLGTVGVIGILTSLIAQRALYRDDLLAALRGD